MITRHKVASFLHYFFQPELLPTCGTDDNTYGADGYVCRWNTYVFATPPGKLPGLQRVEVPLYLTLKRKSARPTSLSPHSIFPPAHPQPPPPPSFRRQQACNAILMMEVSSDDGVAFTPRYGARVNYTTVPVILFHDLNCIDCVTPYNSVAGYNIPSAAGRGRKHCWRTVKLKRRLLNKSVCSELYRFENIILIFIASRKVGTSSKSET